MAVHSANGDVTRLPRLTLFGTPVKWLIKLFPAIIILSIIFPQIQAQHLTLVKVP